MQRMGVFSDLLLIAVCLFAFARQVGGACSNSIGDASCASRLAQTDYCQLTALDRCSCVKDCNASTDCGNTDITCDCPFNVAYCDQSWLSTQCPASCARRTSVTCAPLISVNGASPLYNGQPPTYSPPLYMDFITFQCDPGFQQTSGSATNALRRVCSMDGSWLLHPDYQQPLVCERVSCGAVPTATLASPSRSSGVFEDTVTYSCDLGYNNTGQGQGTHMCNASAVWERTEDDPVCTLVQCGAPPSISNATPSADSGPYLTAITYSCQSGYDKTGGGTGHKQCSATGVWTPVAADLDVVCTPKPCPALPAVTNAVPSSPSGAYRDIVTYACATGYSQSGGSTGQRTCTVAGTWFQDQPDPVCTIVSCGTPPVVTNCARSVESGNYGDEVTYSCVTGYSQSGGLAGRRTCSAAGTWDLVPGQSDPVCTIVSCGTSISVPKAQASAPSGTYGDLVTYTCLTGYTQSGGSNGRRRCTADGSWVVDGGDSDPVCTAVSCGPSPIPVNTQASAATGTYGDVVTYTCIAGYNQSGGGTGRRTCDSSGSWIVDGGDSDPVCSLVSCGWTPTVSNADASRPSGTYGDVVTYTCSTGYILAGGSTGKRKCSTAGTWDVAGGYPDPVCTRVSCGATPSRVGATPSAAIGYFGDNVTYVCLQTHISVGGGAGRVTCNSSGLWEDDPTDSVPLCVGEFVKFVNSKNEAQVAPPDSMTSTKARSNLHCASVCALSAHCHGYNFRIVSGVCEMNMASALPVISDMKKLYD